jgi:hypothetical protein
VAAGPGPALALWWSSALITWPNDGREIAARARARGARLDEGTHPRGGGGRVRGPWLRRREHARDRRAGRREHLEPALPLGVEGRALRRGLSRTCSTA